MPPCRIPLFTLNKQDRLFFHFTVQKILPYQLIKILMTWLDKPLSNNLLNNLMWFIRSNAFDASNDAIYTVLPCVLK